MTQTKFIWLATLLLITITPSLYAQKAPYDVFPPAEAPYYRVRYEASTNPGELTFPVNYTIWIPKDVKNLRSVHGSRGFLRVGKHRRALFVRISLA